MTQQPNKAWRVVLPDRVVLEYDTREEAKTTGRRTGGKVQGYVPAQGWIPEKYIAESQSRNVLERFVNRKKKD